MEHNNPSISVAVSCTALSVPSTLSLSAKTIFSVPSTLSLSAKTVFFSACIFCLLMVPDFPKINVNCTVYRSYTDTFKSFCLQIVPDFLKINVNCTIYRSYTDTFKSFCLLIEPDFLKMPSTSHCFSMISAASTRNLHNYNKVIIWHHWRACTCTHACTHAYTHTCTPTHTHTHTCGSCTAIYNNFE